jgi:hypothetical protein
MHLTVAFAVAVATTVLPPMHCWMEVTDAVAEAKTAPFPVTTAMACTPIGMPQHGWKRLLACMQGLKYDIQLKHEWCPSAMGGGAGAESAY